MSVCTDRMSVQRDASLSVLAVAEPAVDTRTKYHTVERSAALIHQAAAVKLIHTVLCLLCEFDW